ncbi:MAG: hypothetical protein AMXMBFR23_07260 [Chloroflexota bacterium]
MMQKRGWEPPVGGNGLPQSYWLNDPISDECRRPQATPDKTRCGRPTGADSNARA